jgi:hypothetical protein
MQRWCQQQHRQQCKPVAGDGEQAVQQLASSSLERCQLNAVNIKLQSFCCCCFAAGAAGDGKDKLQPYQVITNPISWSSGPAAAVAATANSSKFGGAADGAAGGGWLHSSGMNHAAAIRQMSAGSGGGARLLCCLW